MKIRKLKDKKSFTTLAPGLAYESFHLILHRRLSTRDEVIIHRVTDFLCEITSNPRSGNDSRRVHSTTFFSGAMTFGITTLCIVLFSVALLGAVLLCVAWLSCDNAQKSLF
jgi:hypothetical protein